jgi:protoporphyrinogen oxidase
VAIPEPGHKKRLLQLKAMLPSEIRLAGAYMGSGAMPDAIAAGMAAVEAGDG